MQAVAKSRRSESESGTSRTSHSIQDHPKMKSQWELKVVQGSYFFWRRADQSEEQTKPKKDLCFEPSSNPRFFGRRDGSLVAPLKDSGSSRGGNHCHRELMRFHASNALLTKPVGQKEISNI